jgi:hypothetical protein
MVPLVLGVVWILYKAAPPGYRQASDFTTEEIEAQAAKFVSASGQVLATLADELGQTPLDVTFTDAMINGHLRAHSDHLEQRLPKWISNPQVLFTEDEVVLMAQIQHEKAETILSIHLQPTRNDDGQIAVKIVDQKAGRLPLPNAIREAMADHFDQLVAKSEARLREKNRDEDRRRYDRQATEIEFWRDAARLCRGQEVTIDTRRYKLRIDELKLADHQLRLVGARVPRDPKN